MTNFRQCRGWIRYGRLVVFALLLGGASTRFARAEDALSMLRLEVREGSDQAVSAPAPKPEKKKPPSDKRAPKPHDPFGYGQPHAQKPCNDSDSTAFWVQAVLWAGTSPFWMPMTLATDDYKDLGYFSKHPYEFGSAYMLIDPDQLVEQDGTPRRYYPWAARARAEYGTNFRHLDWVEGQLLLETGSRLGLDADWRWLHENRPAGGDDSLHLGAANLFFRFAQGEQLQGRAGGGFNWLADPTRNDFGVNFTYALDFYPRKPWVISLESDLGTLGRAGSVHLRATAGLEWRGGEGYLGYDYLDIGRFQVGGLIAGLRLWF